MWPLVLVVINHFFVSDQSAHCYDWMAPLGVGMFCLQLALTALGKLFPQMAVREASITGTQTSDGEPQVPTVSRGLKGMLLLLWFSSLLCLLGSDLWGLIVNEPTSFDLEVTGDGERIVVFSEHPRGSRSRVLDGSGVSGLQWHMQLDLRDYGNTDAVEVLQVGTANTESPLELELDSDLILFWTRRDNMASRDTSAQRSGYRVLCELLAAELGTACAEPRVWPMPGPIIGCASE